MDGIILQNSYRNHGSYPIYTLGASIGHVDDDTLTLPVPEQETHTA